MSLEQTIDNLQIRNANMVTFVGTSNTMVDTTTGRIQTKGIQHNSNVITDVSGPHGRGVATLKKYPDIIFEKEKFEYNNSSNTYTQAGYTVSVSSQDANLTNDERGIVYYMFDGAGAGPYDNQWTSASASNYSAGTFNNTNAHYQIAATDVDGATIPHGEWIKLKMPKKIRLERVFLQPNLNNMNETPEDFKIYGSNDGTTWKLLITQTGMVPRDAGNDIVPATTISGYYDEYAIVITKIYNNAQPDTSIEELEFYGYEEDPPAGDHSVDTTFKSRFNNPQTTGVQVLVDGATGVGTNQISGGPDPSGNQSTYVTDGKYWTLNGTLTSNLAVEANTFLEGDQPHAVSVWFNSSNLEANVSNTCVFSIASEEKLDSQNLDLQSNTWHNLTYVYQGEGGSRVTYLDGRKVAEDQAEDTFGAYPPFDMTGFSQGGYVVSASSEHNNGVRLSWKAFESGTGNETGLFMFNETGPKYGPTANTNAALFEGLYGEWIKLELPEKIYIDWLFLRGSQDVTQSPEQIRILGSNDDVNWDVVKDTFTVSNPASDSYDAINSSKAYKYIVLQVIKVNGSNAVQIKQILYYGHRENDLVRLPDPTNVLKYPHLNFTNHGTASTNGYHATALRGYVVSASTKYSSGSNTDAWRAFDGVVDLTSGSGGQSWDSATNTYASSGTGRASTGTTTFNSRNGEWINIKFPHKVLLTSYQHWTRMDRDHEGPYSGYLYGSNDGFSTFQEIHRFAAITLPTTSGGVKYLHTVSSSYTPSGGSVVTLIPYNEYRLQVTHTQGSPYLNIALLEFYGTGVDSIPIQIGGGNIDKVANFRVYDRFIEEDQVNEIWNAQKEEFGRAKPQMVLQQGKLGIGTDAPQGSLSVADEPHNVEEFPPTALTGYKTYIEGHGEFCVSTSNVYDSNYTGYKAFNKNSTGTSGNWWSQSDAGIVPRYSTSNGTFSYFSYDSQYSTNVEGATKMGHWLQIEFPYKINYKYSEIEGPHHSIGRHPRAGYILGSNDLTGVWTSLHNFTNVTRTHKYESVRYTPPTVSTQTFKYFRLVIEEQGNYQYAGIARWDIFGTREQGQSVLHDGQLTLTKNLDVPRIGPPLDADDTPRRDRLVVEYNTSTNPTFEGAVRDTSGRGNDGVLYGGAYYDANEKALVFDGTDDYTQTRLNNPAGDYIHSASLWFKTNKTTSAIGTNEETLFQVGSAWSAGVNIYSSFYGDSIYFAWHTHNIYCATTNVSQKQWNHLCMTYSGGGSTLDSRKIYLNGKVQSATLSGTSGQLLNLPENTFITLGDKIGATHHLDGYISNFKFYNTALTAEEVKTLYDMGRNGKIIPKTLQIDTPVQINAPLYAPKNVINITQSFYDGSMSTTSTTLQDVYTTEWIQMRKNSEVEVDLSVLYRNDGNNWGGMYLLAFFMVDVPVGSVAANTWVAYLTPGYYMSYYHEIYEYGNTSYLPFKIPTDYKIRFKFQVRVYNNGTLYINRSHALHFENSQFANLNQFIPMTTKEYQGGGTYYNGHTGGTKFIIKEIAG